jgi:DNA-binding NarL/FixJ family response regulator
VGPRILIAEDHENLRGIVVAMLSSEFQVVGAVGDGEQLVQAAVFLQPDVIVSDIRMPAKDGLTAREELRLKGVNPPFVFMTMLEPADLSSFITAGAVGYVHKTDLFNELKLAINAALLGKSYLSQTFQEKLGSGGPPGSP